MEAKNSNLAETLAKEMKQPVAVCTNSPDEFIQRVALPPGWTVIEKDDERFCESPRRKTANVSLHDAESFITYINRHSPPADEFKHQAPCTIWCKADYKAGKVAFTGILNDLGTDEHAPAWRDHRAEFSPEFSEEWTRWAGNNRAPFNQTAFATFIEDNLKDIVEGEGSPSGAAMLDMALSFEANQDMRFKSAIRLQNGGVQMSFVQDDDSQTLAKMQVFDRFSIGLPVFWNGDAYRVEARLRYRVKEGRLTFWYELIRHDKTLEAATQTLIAQIKEKTDKPFFFGDPFSG